jgi:hypothetical protein
VHIHTNTPTCTPTCVKNREGTENTPIFFSVKNNPTRQATSSFINQKPKKEKKKPAEPLHPRSPTLNEETTHT